MNKDSLNKSYNLIWKNIIIKKNVSLEYADKCISLFNNDKRLYLYKEECNTEINKFNEMEFDNIKKGLDYIDAVIKIHKL